MKSNEPKPAVSTGKLVPTTNPFSNKKRQHSEMTKADNSTNGNGNGVSRSTPKVVEKEDVSMQDVEEVKSAASDVKMQSAAETFNENVTAQKNSNESLPNSTSNTE